MQSKKTKYCNNITITLTQKISNRKTKLKRFTRQSSFFKFSMPVVKRLARYKYNFHLGV